MKILNLKFKNINSLSGENEIDFTNPMFTNDGLFAITGKTGSGKSSILDAISLAFYGKTPRVDITGKENAVMTKGENDCYAEIIFEVAGKIWKSSWKQELNRNGNLKPVERVIADFEDKIIADQIRTCEAKIVEIIGLTFEQFTKVIMLAQGSFAAFLQAKQNEKGELLEQITGTEIYAVISRKVFERNRAEKSKLDRISLELSAIKILSDEDIATINNENSELGNNKKQVDEKLQKIEIAKNWIATINNLKNHILEAKQKLPELEEKAIKAKENFKISENALKGAKADEKKQEPIFKKVRELDTKISEKEKLLQPILKAISLIEKSKMDISKTLDIHKADLDNLQTTLSEKQNWALNNKIYEELISNYSAIEKENQLLVNLSNEIKKLNAEIAKLKKDLSLKVTNAKKSNDIFNEKHQFLTAKTNELETKRAELSEILGGKELSEFLSEKENISNFVVQIKSLIEVENAINTNQQELELYNEAITQFVKSNNELSEKIDADKLQISNLESQINILHENIELRKTIQSLDEHRKNLQDGEECPLCGSLEHPFARGNVPQIGDKEKELVSLKSDYQAKTKAIQKNEKLLVKSTSDKDNAIKNKAREEKALSNNLTKQKEISSEINSINPDFSILKGENKIELMNDILTKKQIELSEIKSLIENASKNEKQLINLRDKEIPAIQAEIQTAEKAKNDAETAQKLAEQKFSDKQQYIATIQNQYDADNAGFAEKLKTYSVDNIGALKKCLDAWNENKKSTDELTSQISILNSNIALNKKEFDNKLNLLKDKQTEKQDIENEKLRLSDERKNIFADKSVEEEDNRLQQLINKSDAAKTNAEKVKNETNTEIEKYKAIISEKEKELSEKQEQKITEKTNDELQSEFNEKKIESDAFSQKIGANNQILKSNSENLKTSGKKIKEKEKQQAVYEKWSILNNLIGSGDGKKYRNFAQALTYEHLIGLSNRQLQKMSDRYILKRTDDINNPFELLVIDKFQNNEERTAQNLSGGEKFIISLSLALGLANMASKSMRIDTMFIDEGFGTLDSDYLDVALNALSNLQSEGKVIGVISHLTELKERIATHIEVVPSGNGNSKIQLTY